MMVARLRLRFSATVDKNTIDVLGMIMKKDKNVKTQSEAVDVLANHYLLTEGLGESAAEELVERLLAGRKILMADIEGEMRELARNIIEEHLASERGRSSMVKVPMPEPVQQRMDEANWGDLLMECKATSAEGIEQWAGQNKDRITASGKSVDTFVCEKLIKVQEKAKLDKIMAYKKANAPIAGETEETKWIRHVSEAMIGYWRSRLDNETLKIEGKRFQVANYCVGVRKVLTGMENGHKEEYLLTLVDRLREDADKRKWDKDQYVKEWKSIYDSSDEIVKRNQNG